MIEAQVPEFFDGGYWYVVEADMESGGLPEDAGSNLCAQYGTVGGVGYAVIRAPEQRTLPPVPVTSSAVIAAADAEGSLPMARKFYARAEGA